jgi:hypothetical protein
MYTQVRNKWEQVRTRQSARVVKEREAGGKPDLLLIKREDMLGPMYLDTSSCTALRDLQAG